MLVAIISSGVKLVEGDTPLEIQEMLREKDTFAYTPQFAMLLAARIIDRARQDLRLRGSYNGGTSTKFCIDGWDQHLASYCAKDFLTRLEIYKERNPEADSIEIAMEILAWLH